MNLTIEFGGEDLKPGRKYRLLKSYDHDMTHTIVDQNHRIIFHFTIPNGYQWNGSDVVADEIKSLRASLIHDYLCEWMIDNDLRNWENWLGAAQEYRAVAIEDGLKPFRAKVRYLGILIGYKFRASL